MPIVMAYSLFSSLTLVSVLWLLLLHAVTVRCSQGSSNNDTSCSPPAVSSTNSSSSKHRHHWVGPIGHRVITVDLNGTGQFRSVQAAVDAVPENNRMNVLINISTGCYMYIYITLITRH